MSLLAKAGHYAWSSAQVLRLGRPDVSLGFLGGIGDDLLCTAPIEAWLQRGAERIWFFTRHPELYAHFDQRVRLIPDDARFLRIAERIGRPMRPLAYSTYEPEWDRDSPIREHLIAAMCRRAGLNGTITLRPILRLSATEVNSASPWADCVAIQSSGLTAAVPMHNKQWQTEKFQRVTEHLLLAGLCVAQIGSASDPVLHGAIDLRGRFQLRETAAVLHHARLFVGTAGFLMHLARAVECPSVIVYGGREPPELTGYICNTNVTHRPPCSPCWQRNRCDFAHVCMEDISPARVIAAIDQRLDLARGPLAAAEVTLDSMP